MPEPSKPNVGVYYGFFDSVLPREHSLSFLAKDWSDADAWRATARAKVLDLLNFVPKETPLNASVESKRAEGGLVVEEISYDMPYGPRTQGTFLYPQDRKARLPTVLALHDHGGFFYFGREKVADSQIQSRVLDEQKQMHYSGRNWASELAKRGFAVLSIDVFLFGSRKIPVDTVNPSFVRALEGLKEGSDEYIVAYNEFADTRKTAETTLLHVGTCWPGVFSYEDRRSVDYLLTREEVDPERIGCGGLSLGGERTIFLSGLDPRIKAGVCVGCMSTVGGLLRNHIPGLQMYIPGIFGLLDPYPDIISMHGPAPLMVQYDREDGLFSLEGMMEADRKIASVYEKMGHRENYVGKFYPGKHKFDAQMQEDAFSWLEKVL